jgi:hypothetical protein
MAHQIWKLPKNTNIDSSVRVTPGAKAYFYQTLTTTPQDTFTTSALNVAHPHPVVADANGVFPSVYLNPSLTYKLTLNTSADVLIYTVDPVNDQVLSQLTIGAVLYPQSAAESGITIVNPFENYGRTSRYGTNAVPGTTDMTTAVQAAHDQAKAGGAMPWLVGQNLITTAIDPFEGMDGDGPVLSGLLCNACNAFTIPSNAGWSRKQAVFRNFSINSHNGTSCDSNWSFYFGGVASGAAVVYNSGFICENISIGRTGRMGGGFYLKDLFGAKITNISMTDITRAFQLVGSVAQASISNIDALLGDSGAGSSLTYIGFSTESATYASGTLTPEHITTNDLSLIVFDIGLQHTSGLDCNFYDTDIQAITTGISINAPADVKGAIIIPHTTGVTAWVGVALGVNPGPKDGRFLSNIEVSMGNMPGTPSSSYAFDMGDGASPVYGVVLKECSVKGLANSLQSLIRGRIHKDLTIENCILEAAVALSTEVSLSSVQRLNLSNNQCPSGIFAVGDGGDSTANGVIVGNQITTLTLSPLTSPQNWTTGQNDGLTPVRHAWEQGTVTLTLTGCTTSPTVDATWVKTGMQVLLTIPALVAVSNTTACSLTGLPANLQPSAQQDVLGRATDNSINGVCGYRFSSGSGTIGMFFGAALGAWTNANNKGPANSTLAYSLA